MHLSLVPLAAPRSTPAIKDAGSELVHFASSANTSPPRATPCSQTSWVDAPGGPEGFYRKLGFVPTGEIDDGEIVASVPIAELVSGVAESA